MLPGFVGAVLRHRRDLLGERSDRGAVLTRTPDGPYSSAQDLVSEWMAAFVVL